MKLSQWFAAEESILKDWATKEINQITTYLSPFLHDIKPTIEKDLIAILKNGLPIVLTALGTNPVGNLSLGLKAAETYIVPALEAEGIKLYQTTINILTNSLTAQAQVQLVATLPPAPVVFPVTVETTIPSGA